MSATGVESLAEQARAAVTTSELLPDAVRSVRKWELEAAYAFARRRDSDRSWRDAADALEVALAERRRSAYSAPHWWERIEFSLG